MIQKSRLRQASILAGEIWLSEVEAGYDPNQGHLFSDSFEWDMKKMAAGNAVARVPVWKKCIVFVFWLVCLGGLLLMVNEDVRAGFVGWLKEQTGQAMIYQFLTQQEAEELPYYWLEWIPDGYGEPEIMDHGHERTVFYENEQGQRLIFSCMDNSGSGSWSVSLESMTVSRVSVNGMPADLLISSDPKLSSAVMWVSEDTKTAFCIEAFLSKDELIYLAESVGVRQK